MPNFLRWDQWQNSKFWTISRHGILKIMKIWRKICLNLLVTILRRNGTKTFLFISNINFLINKALQIKVEFKHSFIAFQNFMFLISMFVSMKIHQFECIKHALLEFNKYYIYSKGRKDGLWKSSQINVLCGLVSSGGTPE